MAVVSVQSRSYGLLRPAFIAAFVALAGVILLQPLFVGSLVFVRNLTDLEPIRQNIATAYEKGVLDVNSVPRSLIHRYGHQFTECTALHLALDDNKDVWKTALTPQLHSAYVAPCIELQLTATGIVTNERTDYSRYWHGYRLYLWPMLEHVSLDGMRYINAFFLLAVSVYFFRSLRGALGSTPAVILVLVLMCLTDIWRIWRITPHFISMIVILAGTGLFAQMYVRYRNYTMAIVLAAVFGAVFNFIDFLINPPMMPMMLSFIVLAAEFSHNPQPTRLKKFESLWLAGLTALSWFGGYTFTWATKWVLAVWLSNDASQSASAIFDQIILRLYGQETGSSVLMIPLLPTLTMIVQSFISVGSITVAIVAAAIFIHISSHWEAFDRQRFLILMSPTIIPVAWFELLSNHTQTHSHFTYRSEAASIAIFFAAAVMATPKQTSLASLIGGLRDALRQRDLAIVGRMAAVTAKSPLLEAATAGEQLRLAFDAPLIAAQREREVTAPSIAQLESSSMDTAVEQPPAGQIRLFP